MTDKFGEVLINDIPDDIREAEELAQKIKCGRDLAARLLLGTVYTENDDIIDLLEDQKEGELNCLLLAAANGSNVNRIEELEKKVESLTKELSETQKAWDDSQKSWGREIEDNERLEKDLKATQEEAKFTRSLLDGCKEEIESYESRLSIANIKESKTAEDLMVLRKAFQIMFQTRF